MPLRQDVAEHEHDSETDDTVRRCALTRERLSKQDLIRFVLAPSGEIVPDLKERLPGRGGFRGGERDRCGRRKFDARADRAEPAAGAAGQGAGCVQVAAG